MKVFCSSDKTIKPLGFTEKMLITYCKRMKINVLPSLLRDLFLVFKFHTYAEKRFSLDRL
jgi:hypothetical protein